jgi:hypothetical protein
VTALKANKITAIKVASQTRDSAKYNVSRFMGSKIEPRIVGAL